MAQDRVYRIDLFRTTRYIVEPITGGVPRYALSVRRSRSKFIRVAPRGHERTESFGHYYFH